MNLLKQSALILGLVSLSIGVWTLFRNWRQKIALQFSGVCFVVAVWALSFVASQTVEGRLSYDIHRFFNIWLAPFGVLLLERLLVSAVDRFSKLIRWIAWIGAIALSGMVSFSADAAYESSPIFLRLVKFWPGMIFIQFLGIVYQDVVLNKTVSLEFISAKKRTAIYFGLAVCLLTCTFDHIPEFGYWIPSIGNLLFTGYLTFSSLVIFPQKLFRVEALLTRFFATLILALVITGFFALSYRFISESFPLFLLNSFLISFAALVLWNPLVALFRFLLESVVGPSLSVRKKYFDEFQRELAIVHHRSELKALLERSFTSWLDATSVKVNFTDEQDLIPDVLAFFLKGQEQNKVRLLPGDRQPPVVLHRYLLDLEYEQSLSEADQKMVKRLLSYLDYMGCDVVFCIQDQKMIHGVIQIQMRTTADEWLLGLPVYAELNRVLDSVARSLKQITQLGRVMEVDRLATLGKMSAGLAHEIRNPLGAIQGASLLLNEALLDEVSRPWVKVIREEVGRLNRLVNQFLDLSRDSHDPPEKTDVIATIQTVIQLMRVQNQPPVQVMAPDHPIYAWFPPDHLKQVLLNLLHNAFLSMDGMENPRVEVRIQYMLIQDQEWVQLKVVDSGRGISDEAIQKIFEPFYSTFKKGTGLGLAICERLIRMNHGSIRAHSREGEGTVFTVLLPKWVPDYKAVGDSHA